MRNIGKITAISCGSDIEGGYIALAAKEGSQIRIYHRNGEIIRKFPKILHPPVHYINVIEEDKVLYQSNERITTLFSSDDQISFPVLIISNNLFSG